MPDASITTTRKEDLCIMTKFRLCLWALALSAVCVFEVSSKDWWENGNFYQIYPRSFQDSDGDGVGDLNGITSRLDYLKELGVSGVWLSPIFKSPMVDFGYDISDYTQIHEEFGTLEDFDRLAKRCRELGIKLILDFVPNHTSDQHDWFKKSAAKESGYEDYYIWSEGTLLENGTRKPPSNWKSIFRFSAWTWNEQRKAFYLHQFLKEQPDLNYRNTVVATAMKDILKLWLGRGVAGFRCDAVPYLFETEAKTDGTYEDEAPSNACDDPDGYCSLIHTNTADQQGTYDTIYDWRSVMDDYQKEFGGDSRSVCFHLIDSCKKFLIL